MTDEGPLHDESWTFWLRLLLTPGIGSSHARRLLGQFGSASNVFEQDLNELADCVGSARARALVEQSADWVKQCDITRVWLNARRPEGATARLIFLGDDDYPSALLQTDDPPLMLYALVGARWADAPAGMLGRGLCRRSMAIVGSRNPTAQGVLNARAFARDLCAAGCTIVSGMALGIDSAAHEGALMAKAQEPDQVPTVAVVGTGLDRVYPRQNHALASQLAEHAVILSEYPLGTPALSGNFPRRNRIISGLSLGTLVVEAAMQSGSLITARMSLEQGRDVYAIPGSIHSPQSHGCHSLIQQGAKLVQRTEDILEDLPAKELASLLKSENPARMREAPADGECPTERSDVVLDAMGYDPINIDALQGRTGLQPSVLQVRLFELEMAGHVARTSSGLLQRVCPS